MVERRGVKPIEQLCSGPGKVCQALAVTMSHNALAIDLPPFSLRPAGAAQSVLIGPRIGITKAAQQPWRYGLAGSRFLSRPFPVAARR